MSESRRLRAASVNVSEMKHNATRDELRKSRDLLKRLTPLRAEYDDYAADIRTIVAVWSATQGVPASSKGILGHVTAFRSWKSELFRREYLVAEVDSAWLDRLAPGCDAVTAPIGTRSQGLDLPPLVLVPESNRRVAGAEFASVVEHEIVHVNQMLRGVSPDEEMSAAKGDQRARFIDVVRCEYEANLLQLVRWPSLFPHQYGLTLDRWCALRGWTQALEKAVLGYFCKSHRLGALLDSISKPRGGDAQRSGLGAESVRWLRDRLTDDLAVAMEIQLPAAGPSEPRKTFRAAARWLRLRRSATRSRREPHERLHIRDIATSAHHRADPDGRPRPRLGPRASPRCGGATDPNASVTAPPRHRAP
jgi:hypothetical protein